MNARAVRNWLLIAPRPAMLKLACGDTVHELPKENGQTWIAVGTSVASMDPDKVEAYSAEGKLLRAAPREMFETEEDSATGDDGVITATIPKGVDSETARFMVVAQLLADAHKFSEVAFDKLVGILDATNRGLEARERIAQSYERLFRKSLEEKLENQASGEPDELLSQMMGQFLAGKMNAGATSAAKSNGVNSAPSNGKAKA